MACHRCKNPVYLVFPPDPIKCPRCKKGMFEDFEPLEQDFDKYPVSPPKLSLRVKQRGVLPALEWVPLYIVV